MSNLFYLKSLPFFFSFNFLLTLLLYFFLLISFLLPYFCLAHAIQIFLSPFLLSLLTLQLTKSLNFQEYLASLTRICLIWLSYSFCLSFCYSTCCNLSYSYIYLFYSINSCFFSNSSLIFKTSCSPFSFAYASFSSVCLLFASAICAISIFFSSRF